MGIQMEVLEGARNYGSCLTAVIQICVCFLFRVFVVAMSLSNQWTSTRSIHFSLFTYNSFSFVYLRFFITLRLPKPIPLSSPVDEDVYKSFHYI